MGRGISWAKGNKQSPEWIAKRVAAIRTTKAAKGFRSTLNERFEKYAPSSGKGCWLWTGPLLNVGYGVLSDGGKHRGILAHRMAWERANGPIPEGMDVCHICDTPSCVNPSHFFLGTQADNNRDAWRKGRMVSALEALHRHHTRTLRTYRS